MRLRVRLSFAKILPQISVHKSQPVRRLDYPHVRSLLLLGTGSLVLGAVTLRRKWPGAELGVKS